MAKKARKRKKNTAKKGKPKAAKKKSSKKKKQVKKKPSKGKKYYTTKGGKLKKSMFHDIDEGALTKKAKRAGMSPMAFARRVVANSGRYSEETRKQAQWAINATKKK